MAKTRQNNARAKNARKTTPLLERIGASSVSKHEMHLKRLARIKGQIEGIERMLIEERYCPEVIQQLKSVSAAVKGLQGSVLAGHMRGCVKAAFASANDFDANEKIEELMTLFSSN